MSQRKSRTADEVRQAIESHHAGKKEYLLEDADVDGKLDLSRLDLPIPLRFKNCVFSEAVCLENAHVRYLAFTGCHLTKGLKAGNLVVDADLRLDDGFRAGDPVHLDDSVIRGTLWGSRAVFEWGSDEDRKRCFGAKNLHVRGDVRMESSCFRGEVKLANAQIDGDVIFANSVFQSSSFTLNLCGARIVGQILLESTFSYGDNVVLSGDERLAYKRSLEWVRQLASKTRAAGFLADGTVHLEHARIGRDLVASGGYFEARELTLRARGIEVGGDVHLRNGFEARGTVELRGAQISGDLDAQGGCFAAHEDTDEAVRGFGLEVGGEVLFGPGAGGQNPQACRIRGMLVFESCRIQKNFECVEVSFQPPADDHDGRSGRYGLDLSRTEVGGELRWESNRGGERTLLRLSYAHAGRYVDDLANDTPHCIAPGHLFLDGFTYDKLGRGGERTAARLAWLHLQPLHGDPERVPAEQVVWPQAFDQLASHYRATGRPQDAKRVAFEKEQEFVTGLRLQRQRGAVGSWSVRWRTFWGLTTEIGRRRFLEWTMGYGYRFHRLGLLFLLFAILGSVIFFYADASGFIQRAGDPMSAAPEDRHPFFYPILYSLDTLVPVLDLHQESHWVVDSASGDGRVGFFHAYLCLHIVAGWVMASLLISGITGIFKD